MSTAEPLVIDFAQATEQDAIRERAQRVMRVEHNPHADQPKAISLPSISDAALEAAKATYASTGGNVSETARLHDLDPRTVQRLALELEWPVYGTESAEKSHRQHMRKVMQELENRMTDLAGSLIVEQKTKTALAQVNSKRELSAFLEPLSSRHAAFKTVFDAWMRLGAMLYPEDFAKDPDPGNWRAAEERAQVRDLALLGGVAGIKRGMEEIISRHFLPGIPDRDRVIEAEVVDDDD